MITAEQLTKHYGSTTVVDHLSFEVRSGRVTGFVGPNGAGKSTTMRMILGLTTPDSGQALVSGRPYRTLPLPMRTVGALLDARAVHPGRSARRHLETLAASNELPRGRVGYALEQTGLVRVADNRVGGFSLGMKQRLGMAGALLGDPEVLVLDEPMNGLDPDGVHWMRNLLKGFAAQGRTVFVSSHLMSELSLVADHLLVLGHGRLVADAEVAELMRDYGTLEDAYLQLTAGLGDYPAVAVPEYDARGDDPRSERS